MRGSTRSEARRALSRNPLLSVSDDEPASHTAVPRDSVRPSRRQLSSREISSSAADSHHPAARRMARRDQAPDRIAAMCPADRGGEFTLARSNRPTATNHGQHRGWAGARNGVLGHARRQALTGNKQGHQGEWATHP
eukprot:scaffold17307_cov119-Isochrysis_galbana.AAC.5